MGGYQTKTKSRRRRSQTVQRAAAGSGYGSGYSVAPAGSPLSALYSAAPAFGLGAPVQAKVEIGQADDAYEREADAVAGHILAGRRAPPISRLAHGGLSGITQREETKPEEKKEPVQRQGRDEEEPVQTWRVQRAEDTEEEQPVQTQGNRANTAGRSATMADTAAHAIQRRGAGEPLNPATRQALEGSMGADLSRVRVHQDSAADEATRGLNARAFTNQNHIWLRPGESQNDLRLMAHEATHVVQQTGRERAVPAIQRQAWGPFMQPRTFPRRPGVRPGEVIELKGTPSFEPSPPLADLIEQSGSAGIALAARFGTLASGEIVIRWDGRAYQANMYWLPMQHPDLVPRESRIRMGLIVWMENNVFHGMVGTAEPAAPRPRGKLQAYEGGIRSIIFGRSYRGPESLIEDSWENRLVGGTLRMVCQFRLLPPDGPRLNGLFSLIDEDFRFMASGPLDVEGAEPTELAVQRTPGGILSGHPKLKLARSWTAHGFLGGIETSFFDGSFEARGRVKIAYPETKPFVTGEVNVVATSTERAWAAANANDPSPHVTGGIQPGNPSDLGLALTGWGRLDLILAPGSPAVGKKPATSPLTARALFLVDPAGDITARGILRMPREYTLVPAFPYPPDPKRIFRLDKQLAGADLFWGIGGDVSVFAEVTAQAHIGPFTLRDLVADGTYSTRPDIGSEIKLAGSFNASAEVGMTAKAGVETSLTIGVHMPWPLPDLTKKVASFDVGLTGEGSIKGYVDARPEIKRVRKGGSGEIPPEYSIHGDLHVAGEILVKLGAGAAFSIDQLVNKGGTVGKEFRLASGGVGVKIDHVFGSGTLPKVKLDKIDFDPKKFVKDITKGTLPAPRGDKVHGAFHEIDQQHREKDVPVSEKETPPRPPPPDRPFELHVPFDIEKRHHDLYLVVKPGASVVEMASGPRKPVSKSLRDALELAHHHRDTASALAGAEPWLGTVATATRTDYTELYDEQIAELTMLLADTLELEAEANALAPEVEYLWQADLPGTDDLAAAIAEYGARYGDDELTGAARLLAGPLEETHVEQTTPRRYTYLGAERIGNTDQFEGSFNDPAWNWTGFPSGPITQHPINTEFGLQVAAKLSDLKPQGPYRFIGGRTHGAESIRGELSEWRGNLRSEAKKRTDELVATGLARGVARKQAENEIADFWAAKGYPRHRFDYLLVLDHTDWECHHIHENSWNGSDDKTNLIYLPLSEHSPITKWFDARRDDIKRHLNIP